MVSTPLVSVLMTAYNREKYIAEAIESVLASSYQNFELIIVDDGSSDNTLTVAKTYEEKDRRIGTYCNPKNLGQFQNRNKAASLATGKYLKYVDSDDKIYPDTLSIMVQGMEHFADAGIGVVFGNTGVDFSSARFRIVSSKNAYLWHYSKGGMLFPGPSGCIFKRECFTEQNGFPLDLGINGDIYLNLKIAASYSVVLFPLDLVFWRKHAEQVDELQQDYFKMHKERFLINTRILFDKSIPLNKSELKRIRLSNKILYIRSAFLRYFLKGQYLKFFDLMKGGNVQLLELPVALLPLRYVNSFRKQLKIL
jgi:glycosyltransferase involved in cell wall biosynthesis